MNLKKRYSYIIIGLLVLVIGIFIVNAAVNKTKAWHSANNILVKIDGTDRTLQYAINNNLLLGFNTYASPSTPNPGHGVDSIWVSVDGSEMTLQDAISTIGLCGSSSHSYTGSINLGHFASEIEVIVDGSYMSLQESIDSGSLVSVDGGWSAWSAWSSCSVTCGGGTQIRTRTCTNPTPYCAGADCVGVSSESQTCNTQPCYTYSWFTGSWSACSAPCATGTQTRTVYCERSDGVQVSDSYCSESKPSSSQTCNIVNCLGSGCDDCPWGYYATWISYPEKTLVFKCYRNGRQTRYFTNNRVWSSWSSSDPWCENKWDCWPSSCLWEMR